MSTTANHFSAATSKADMVDALMKAYDNVHGLALRLNCFPPDIRDAALESAPQEDGHDTRASVDSKNTESAWTWLNQEYKLSLAGSAFTRESRKSPAESFASALFQATRWWASLQSFCQNYFEDGVKLIAAALTKSSTVGVATKHEIFLSTTGTASWRLSDSPSVMWGEPASTTTIWDATGSPTTILTASRSAASSGPVRSTTTGWEGFTHRDDLNHGIPPRDEFQPHDEFHLPSRRPRQQLDSEKRRIRRARLMNRIVVYEEKGERKRVTIASYGEDFLMGPYYRLRSNDRTERTVDCERFDEMIVEVLGRADDEDEDE